MIKVAMLPFLIAATAALLSGQSISSPPPLCGGMKISGDGVDLSAGIPPTRRFAPPSSGDRLCSQYTYGGWGDTFHLYLGEGAAEHRELLDRAVALWNEVLIGFNRKPAIEIADHAAPKNFSLPDGFWASREQTARELEDGQSVIYFRPAEEETSTGGFAHLWARAGRMIEADVFVNTQDQVKYGSDLALSIPILQTEQGAIYALVDPLFLTVVHEIGHALGLKHVSVSGNVMSYNYMPAMRGKWLAAAEFMELVLYLTDNEGLLDQVIYQENLSSYLRLSSEWELYLRSVYTRSVGLGEQDRMALMCIYDFTDWNH